MKIEQATIFGFGKWHDRTFDFKTNIELIYGLNEAGKSTLSSFITGVLFGFATKKQPYQQYLPKAGHSYGGTITIATSNKRRFVIKRVGGKAGGIVTVTDEDGKVYGEQFLTQLLAPITPQLFQAVFHFDERSLNQIFHLSKADLNQHLLAVGAVGSDKWLQQADTYQREAGKLYRQKGRIWPLNVALKQLAELQKKVNQARGAFPKYMQLAQEKQEKEQQLAKLTRNATQLSQKKGRIERLVKSWPDYQTYLQLKQVGANQSIKLTDQDLARYSEYKHQLALTTADLQQVSQKIAEQTKSQALTPAFQFYIANNEIFGHLLSQKDQIEQLLASQELLVNNQQATQLEQQELESELGIQTIVEPLSKPDLAVAQRNFTEQTTLRQQLIEQEQLRQQMIENNTQLEQKVSELEQETPESNHWPAALGISLVVTVIGLLLPGGLKLVSLVGLAISCWFIYQQQIQRNTENKINTEWQQALAQLDTQKEQLQVLTTKLTQLRQRQAGLQQIWDNLKARYHYQALTTNLILNRQHDLGRLQQLQLTMHKITEQLTQQQQQIIAWLEKFSFAQEWLPINKQEPEKAVKQIITFYQEMQHKASELGNKDQQYTYYQEQAARLHQQSKDWQKKQSDFLTQHHLVSDHELQKSVKHQQLQREQQQQFNYLANQLGDLVTEFKGYSTQAQVQTALVSVSDQEKRLRQQLMVLQQQLVKLQATMQQLVSDGTYQDLLQQVAQQEAQISDLTQQWLAKRLASDWITATLTAASTQRFPQLLKLATRYFAILTNNRYDKISVAPDLITVRESKQATIFAVGELSQGTAEQLYVAFKLAFAQEISDVAKMPFIIDDGFINFDLPRRQAILKLLRQISQHNQVIYFTANEADLNSFAPEEIIQLKREG
ncbi:ATP-binding protein [Loigolactobacillus iwatensis]|uniref:ATP-binding protein n=1 Tax=Loigolactobacillus iwatensis TaxID=1267156 RepID=UPI0013DDA0D8|nr:AAA family ATPase [Loigolactobacillus iwatensis]